MRRYLAVAGCLLALSFSTSVRAADPSDPHYFAGLQAFTTGNYEKAVKEMKASIAAKPSTKASIYLGNAFLKLGRLDEAKSALEDALKLDPNGPKRDQIEKLIRGIEARQGVRATITSTPPGATIFIDSMSTGAQGVTPLDLAFPLGQHQVIAVLDGYETARVDRTVVAGQPITIDIPMRTAGCDASLTADPKGTSGSVDGAAAVSLPATVRVPPGDHKVTFSEEGSEPTTLALHCDGNGPVALSATLGSKARLKIPNDPGQVVTIDGKVVPITAADIAAGIKLPAGHHTVSITSPNNPPWTKEIDVSPGEEIPVGAQSEMAIVMVRAKAPALYVGADGGGNLALRNWKLGSNSFISADGEHGVHPGSSGTAGLRVGFRFLPRLAAEGEIGWVGLPNSYKSTSVGMTYDVNVVFDVLKGNWIPFVQGGVGMYRVLAGDLGTDSEVRGHLGIGLRAKLADWLFARVDARDVIARGFDSTGANNIELLGGLEAVVWQKREPAAPVVTGRN